jgi:hypothetical protein
METPLSQFVDQRGRTWRLELNYSLAKRLREVTSLDFVNYQDGKALLAIHDSDEKLVQVLWLLCESQAQASSVGEEEFGAGLGGDALEQAIEALEQALINYSRPARRQAMQAIRDKAHELVAAQTDLATTKIRSPKVTQLMEAKIREVSEQIDRQIDAAMQTPSTSGNSATSGPVSSGSYPDHSRFGN